MSDLDEKQRQLDENKAQLERLRQIRDAQQPHGAAPVHGNQWGQGTGQQSPWQQQSSSSQWQQHAAPAGHGHGHQPVYAEEYVDDDEDDDFDEQEHEEMLNRFAPKDEVFEEMMNDLQAASQAQAATDDLDEEEILQAAKFGRRSDVLQRLGSRLAKMRDNKGRTVLHYLAECGSAEFVAPLIQFFDPATKDDDGLTPGDIALIMNDAAMAAQLGGDMARRQQTMSQFAIAAPKFALFKAPPLPAASGAGAFWGKQGGDTFAAFSCHASDLGDTSEPLPKIENVSHEPTAWSHAIDSGTPDEHARGHVLTVKAEQRVLAAALVVPIGNVCASGAHIPMPAYAVSRAEAAKGGLRALLDFGANYFSNCVVAFASHRNLAPRFTPICPLRWYVRCIEPVAVLRSAAAPSICADVFRFYAVTRCDFARKHSVTSAPRRPWRTASGADCSTIRAHFDRKHEESLLSFATSEEALQHLFFKSSFTALICDDHSVLVQRRLAGDVHVALVVADTLKSSEDLADFCGAVRSLMPEVACVAVANVGHDEGVFAKANFSAAGGTQFLYCGSAPNAPIIPPCPAVKVSLPLLF
jgi:hypothetical protein